MMNHKRSILMSCAVLALAACGGQDAEKPKTGSENHASTSTRTDFATVSLDDLKNAANTPAEWMMYGGTYDEQRYSRLKSITTDNVSNLGVAWTYDLATNRGVEATPVVVDGVMYVTSAWSVVYALDAKTGEELWVYDPAVDRAVGVKACCDVVNRGVAVLDGKVYVGVIDGRLEALDAKTGEVAWSTVTVDQSKPFTITGAPRVVDGKVLIGNGGAELGVRGYLSAYDAKTGELDWRFYTVPNPEKKPDGAASDSAFEKVGNITWGADGAWVTDGGGGTVWDSIIYDEVNDLIIFGVGNGSPWNRNIRDPEGGDNLFLSSIVAVKPDTGEYVWHFQTTPGDNWDYTATQTIILADLPIGENGAPRRVAMQAPKNGFFYVIDAATGEFISGKGFVPQSWTTGLDEKGRPIEVPESRYGVAPIFQTPGALGAHNWHPMAFNPEVNLAYIPAQEIPQAYAEDPVFRNGVSNWNTGSDFATGVAVDLPPGTVKGTRAMLKGRLIAWDPIKQEERWVVEHDNAWNGGILTTAGNLVFQGKLNGTISAYNAATGEKVWTHELKSGGGAAPSTYEIDGEQYVSIATGWGSAYALAAGFGYDDAVPSMVGKVVTFKLGAHGEIPDTGLTPIEAKPQAEVFGSAELQLQGGQVFARNCAVCHGQLAVSSGVLPDLRWSPLSADAEAWQGVVIGGERAANGMVSFSNVMTAEEAEAIRAYVVKQANNAEGR